VRELQADLPLSETAHERIAGRVIRAAIPKEAKRRTSEKKQLQESKKLLDEVASKPDPKIGALITDLEHDVLSVPGEKAIIFTEYLDTLLWRGCSCRSPVRFEQRNFFDLFSDQAKL